MAKFRCGNKRKRIIFGWMKLTEGVGYVGEREKQ